MSSRGRGYGGYSQRGSYSGRSSSGYRGSYRGSGRGSYEGRGRGGSYSSYNNDTRYSSSGGNRYPTSRDRIDDSYKKPYRSESSAYSTREYGRSGSPDRKRMRMEGSGDRRSHDGGGHYGGSYGGRQEMYSERRSFSGEDRRRSPSREYRKPSAMGPPREPMRSAPRMRAPRRSFRGRMLRSRATYRGAPRSRPSFRRFETRPLGYTRAFRTIKGRSSVKSKEDEASSTEEDWDADDKDEETIEDKKEAKIKSPKAEEDGEGSDGEAGEAGDDGDTDKEPELADAAPRARPYVHLLCVHCKEKSATFAGYAKHLLMGKHRAAMSAVSRRHKMQLLRMRVAQREAQRSLEAATGAELAAHTAFCLVCRLNHRTTRHSHNQSDTHRAMKRFLMPFCRVCKISFRSPMIYEHHICSLDHLKKKANRAARRVSPKVEGSGDEGMDVDLENFMTLDSVGDVDEVEDEDSGAEKKDSESPKKPKVEINIGSDHIKKLEVWWCELCRVYLPRAEPGGAEEAEALRRHCRLRNHLGRYVQHRDTRTLRKHAERIHRQLHQQKGMCELCRVYLPRAEPGGAEEAEALRRHCRLRNHLGRYVQHRDTRTLRKHAERIHRQLHQQKGMCELCRVYLPRAEPGGAEEAEALRRHCRLRNHLGRYVQHRDTRTLRKHAERIHRQLHQQKGMCELCRVYLPRAEPGGAEEAEALRRHCRLRNHLGRYVQHRDTRTLRKHAERIHRQLHQQKGMCELCRVYLPRAEPGGAEEAEALRRHCRLRNHLGRYVQHRDTRTLRKHAERIHRQLHQQKGMCELCRVYLPRAEPGGAEEAEALRRHCRLRNHLGRYVQHRDTRTLRKHAERIHRQLHQQKGMCELCRVYLPRAEPGGAEEAEALRRHCRLRNHLGRYVQHRDTRTLRKHAERIHRQLHQQKGMCELCRVYLPRAEPGGAEEAEALRRHCRLRNHLGRYVQHRDTRTLRKHAERIHRQLHQQKGMCELCRVYLPRAEPGGAEEAEALRRHCRLRNHLGRYVQHRDTRTLRKHAERIHRQLHQQKGMCELCRVYLPRAEPGGAEEAEALRRHCRLRNHLGRYVQHRDTRTLRKHAERIHRQLHQQKGMCELCRVYLPRAEPGGAEEAEALRRHCRLRNHLGRYVQHRDTRTLRKHAERIHRQLHQQKGMCELCRVYLPRAEPGGAEEAEALRRHCRLRNHLGRYVQHRDTRTLRKHAERIHRQLHQQKEDNKETNDEDATEKIKEEKSEPVEEKKKVENGDSVNATGEDKLWADVDKDIGDLLREVRPTNEGSDDDEDLGRYDKFRKSDKKGKADGEETETNEAESLEKPNNEVTAPA